MLQNIMIRHDKIVILIFDIIVPFEHAIEMVSHDP